MAKMWCMLCLGEVRDNSGIVNSINRNIIIYKLQELELGYLLLINPNLFVMKWDGRHFQIGNRGESCKCSITLSIFQHRVNLIPPSVQNKYNL